VNDLIPVINLRNLTEDWSVAYNLCALRGLIFYDTKVDFLNEALNRTQSYLPRKVITLTRHDQTSKMKREKDSTPPLFIQSFKQLHHLDPAVLRQNDRAFEVKLVKEGATDAGGPYREVITQVRTSQSPSLFLGPDR